MRSARILSVLVILSIALALMGCSRCCSRAKSCNVPCEIESKQQTMCPVKGMKINKQLYSDYMGERVYFCCEGCIEKFEKDPETYIRKMKEDGVILDRTPDGR